eukprot:4661571-Pleurochrysis_carterae.AAC.1
MRLTRRCMHAHVRPRSVSALASACFPKQARPPPLRAHGVDARTHPSSNALRHRRTHTHARARTHARSRLARLARLGQARSAASFSRASR